MKRMILIICLVLLVISVSADILLKDVNIQSGPTVVLNEQKTDKLNITFKTPRLTWENRKTDFMNNSKGEEFIEISAGEYAFTLEEGKPQMPMMTSVIDAPHNAEISINIVNADFIERDLSELGIDKRIIPALHSSEKMPGVFQNFVIDNEIYSSDAYYPDRIAQIMDNTAQAGYARGHRLVTIAFYPVQYNPVTNTVRIYTSADIEVEFVNGNISETQNAIMDNYSHDWEEYISSIAINDLNIAKGVPTLPVYYDIFYNSAYSAAADSLAFWKSRKGYKVRTWDATGWSASDIQDTIFDQTTMATYLVIIGDPNASNSLPASGTGGASSDQTDLYYATESGYLPDLYYARLSVSTADEAMRVVRRLLDYEHAQFGTEGFSWLTKATFIAGYDSGNQTVGMATNWYCRNILVNNGYTVDTLVYAENEEEERVVSAINAGTAWTVYTAHGMQYEWCVGYYGNFHRDELPQLTNENMYTMPCGHCCLANDFEWTNDCFGETWPKLEGGGGVSYFGSVPSTYWDEDDWLQRRYFDALYTDSITGGLHEVGRFTQWGLYWIYNNTSTSRKQYYFEAYHVMNDPSMNFWTAIPETLVVVHDDFIPTGSYSMSIEVYDTDGSTPLEDALVCVWGKDETTMHVSGYSNASGIASLTVDCSSPGDSVYVTVTKHNYIPYEAYAMVGAGGPSETTSVSYFDYARVPEIRPTLTFTATDGENDDLRYRIMIDDNPLLSSPDSFTTGTYTQGENANYTLPSDLSDNTTYWWKVKAQDPSGSGYWGGYSGVRCFTVSTALGNENCSWYSCCNEQHQSNTFISTVLEGDSMLLGSSGGTTVDTQYYEGFEGGSMPSGWTVVNGNGDSYEWYIDNSGLSNMGGYDPPNCGNYVAYYDDDEAGSSSPYTVEYLYTPSIAVSSADTVILSYGWGFRLLSSGDEYMTGYYRVHQSGSWGSWTEVNTYSSSGSGTESINLTSQLPMDSVALYWLYDDGDSWAWASSVDNITLIGKNIINTDAGEIITPVVAYDELYDTYTSRTSWGNINWKINSPDDSILLKVEYLSSGTWDLIPDNRLAGNSDGFTGSPNASGHCSKNIDGLNTSTYDSIRAHYYMYRKGTKSAGEPSISAIEIGNLISSMTSVNMVNMIAEYSNGNVVLKWEAVGDEGTVEWIIERKQGNIYNEISSIDGDRSGSYVYKDSDIESGREYVYRVVSVNGDNIRQVFMPVKVMTGYLPTTYALMAPNPSIIRSSAVITYHVPKAADITIDMYDISGRHTVNLYNGIREQGVYNAMIHTDNIPSGTYFIIMKSEDTIMKEKATVIK